MTYRTSEKAATIKKNTGAKVAGRSQGQATEQGLRE
jgi:hypothetical protein